MKQCSVKGFQAIINKTYIQTLVIMKNLFKFLVRTGTPKVRTGTPKGSYHKPVPY